MKRMIVLDGNSIMFRAYFATAMTGNLMQTRSGLCTNAVYGFANMLSHIKKTYEFDNIVVAFDKGKKTLRHQAYNEYKGGRNKTPEELLMQIPYVKEYLDCLEIKHLELDDYEADDIVGTYATLASPYFDEVMVISGDKDLLQLAKGNIHVYLTKKGLTDLVMYTEDNFMDLMNIKSSQMTDYKGLIGDSSDNLPGVTGVGEKTAQALLLEYGTLENILNDVDNIKGKLGEHLKEDKDVAVMCKKLATLYTNVDVKYSIEDTLVKEPDIKVLRSFYEKLEFKSFIQKLANTTSSTNEITEPTIEKIDKNISYYINDLDVAKRLLKTNKVSIEVETDCENYHKANVLGISIASINEGVFIDSLTLNDLELQALLVSFDLHVYSIDSKKLYTSLKYLGINLKHIDFDVILAEYVIDPSKASQDIKSIFDEYLENNITYFEEVYSKKTKYIIPPIEILSKYAINKASYIFDVKPLMEDILKCNNQLNLLYDCELPLAIVLSDMEYSGFMVDPIRLKEIGKEFKSKMDYLEQEIYSLSGVTFNISSPKQLGEVLFDKLGLAPLKKNKTGLSTSAEVLEELSKIHPVPKMVLEYRKYSKLVSTYVDGLLEVLNPVDSKLHTVFKQSLTLTGRLSSTEPNIQNIPIRTDDGKLIRSAFIPSFKDGVLVSADYSQIELRILAHLSNCKNMIDMFNSGVDLHTSTASKVFNKNFDEVTKDERRMAKAVNFGIVYGMSAWGLSEEIKVTPQEASQFINKYFELFPEIKTYLDDVVKCAKQDGYTTTILNRRRYMPDINSSNGPLRQFAERTSKNAPIQGSAADIIKLAMINVANKLKENNLKSKLIAQVHDELIIDTDILEKDIVSKILKETMESVISLKVKLIAELEEGYNWDMK